MQIVYEIGTYVWFLRHGVLTNGSMSWIPWQEYSPKYDSTLKLLSDYVDDRDQTNRFVTAAEKTAISKIGDKVDKVEGKGLSTNDYTTAEKTKLAGLENYDDTELRSEIHALNSNITASTTISAYVNSLSKGHYTSFILYNSVPSDSPLASTNAFVEIIVYSATTAMVRLTPVGTTADNKYYTNTKSAGTWRGWYRYEAEANSSPSSQSFSPSVIGTDNTI